MPMFNIFKYIGYAFKAKQGINAPDELLADTSFGLVEGFFILCVDIAIYRKIKKFVGRISRKVTSQARNTINNYRTVDIEATDVH